MTTTPEIQDYYVSQAIEMLRSSGYLGGEERWFLLAVLEGRVDDILRREDKHAKLEELKGQYSSLRQELDEETERAVCHVKTGDAAQG